MRIAVPEITDSLRKVHDERPEWTLVDNTVEGADFALLPDDVKEDEAWLRAVANAGMQLIHSRNREIVTPYPWPVLLDLSKKHGLIAAIGQAAPHLKPPRRSIAIAEMEPPPMSEKRRALQEKLPEIIAEFAFGPALSFVIPYRARSGSKRLLRAVVGNLRAQTVKNIEILVIEDGPKQTVEKLDGVDMIRYTKNRKTFAKCRALNEGVSLAHSPLVVLHDADILVPAHYGQALLRAFNTGAECVKLSSNLVLLGKRDTKAALKDMAGVWDMEVSPDTSKRRECPWGSIAVTARAYRRVGGMDEKYKGWGHQDKSFLRVARETLAMVEKREIVLIHLNHPIASRDTAAENMDRYKAELKRSVEEIVRERKASFDERYPA